MATRKYDVCVGTKGKDDKTYWNKVGVVLQTEKGFRLKMESIPVAWDGWAALFEPKPAGNGQTQSKPAQPPARDGGISQMSDDIPF